MPDKPNAFKHDRFTGEYSFRLDVDKDDLLGRLSRIEKLCTYLNKEALALADTLTAGPIENHRPEDEAGGPKNQRR